MELPITQNNGQNLTPPPTSPQEAGSGGGKKIIKREGRVVEALPNAFFKVVLDDNPSNGSPQQGSGQAGQAKEIIGFLSGKMRLNRIKILPGDKVTLEMSEYDMGKGRIV